MQRISRLGLFVWSLAILFYLFEFCVQVFLGTIATELLRDLHLRAEQFAILGSTFYISYALMQLNVGVLCNKFGVRYVVLTALLMCILGAYILYLADNFYIALIARVCLGVGSSCAFVPILILALNWFPRPFFSLFVGIAQLLGALGPLIAGVPCSFAVQYLDGDWRRVLLGMIIFGLALFLVMLLFLKSKPASSEKRLVFLERPTPVKEGISEIMRNKQLWPIFLYAASIYVANPLFGAYWGNAYLQSRSFSKLDAAFITSMIWVGMALFCPLIGVISRKIVRRKGLLLLSSIVGFSAICCILYLPIKSVALLSGLFFLIGVASSGQSLTFSLAAENVPKKFQSIVLGLNNFFMVFAVALISPIVTFMINSSANSNPIFTATDFQSGFLLVPIFYSTSFFIALFMIKETFCKGRFELHKIDLYV